ncbi:MAG: hypothetical protein J2O48_04195 [Solirubrobacterales bacterium]|nr:hypothetical protein [Solirubrobacterales bacterium]
MKKLTIAGTVGTLAAAPAVALASTAAPVSHAIVPYKSIGPVKIGQTAKQVDKELGKPSATKRANGKVALQLFAKRGLEVLFDSQKTGKVIGIAAASPTYKTPNGLHAGSTEAQVKKAYPKAVKSKNDLVVAQNRSKTSPELVFEVSSKKVAMIEVININPTGTSSKTGTTTTSTSTTPTSTTGTSTSTTPTSTTATTPHTPTATP